MFDKFLIIGGTWDDHIVGGKDLSIFDRVKYVKRDLPEVV